MAQALAYPTTESLPAPQIDLSDPAQRHRLSGPALRSFLEMMRRWHIRDEDARGLLGGMAASTFYAMKKRQDTVLEEDRLRRISYLLGIHKGLHTVFAADLADRWVTMPNQNAMFAGATPLAYMLRGGQPAMHNVRRLIEAYAAGH
jgi:hypothetical protein